MNAHAMLAAIRAKSWQVRRGLRRLRARWRLHRMEWNGMQAPLEPPPGYESFVVGEDVISRLMGGRTIRSWSHFRTTLREGWKLYKHQYFPNPELVEEERRAEQQREAMIDELGKQRSKSRREIEKEAKSLFEHIKDAAPKSTGELGGRLDILQTAIDEFMIGYTETSTGSTTIFGNHTYNEDLVEPSNPPIVYRVDHHPRGTESEHIHEGAEQD